MKISTLSIALSVVFLSACAANHPQTKYEWGSYEESVYSYYKNPAKVAEFSAAMETIISNAEKASRPVPPGIYAEYGYLLIQQGRTDEGLAYFDKEKQKWPESAVFMATMKTVSLAGKKPDAEGMKK